MCKFCKDIAMNDDEYMKKRYVGGDFICKDENGFGILIDTGDSGCLGYIKINYCPVCGRKLEPSDDDVSTENKKKFVQIMRQLTAKRKE